jgi:hypothetical protein
MKLEEYRPEGDDFINWNGFFNAEAHSPWSNHSEPDLGDEDGAYRVDEMDSEKDDADEDEVRTYEVR